MASRDLPRRFLERLANEPHTRLRYFCSPQHTDSAFYPIIGQMERAAKFAHGDSTQVKLDKLDALLGATSTSAHDLALLADMLSLPNDGRYPRRPDAAPTANTERASRADGSARRAKADSDDFRGCALVRPHELGSARSDCEPDSDTSSSAARYPPARV